MGAENFSSGLASRDHRLIELILRILSGGRTRTPSLAEVERSDAVFVLGEDVPDTAPRVALALHRSVREQPMAIARKLRIPDWDDAAVREAIQDERGPLFVATPAATRLDALAAATVRAAPADLARLGFAVAHAIQGDAPAVSDLPGAMAARAESIARALRQAESPLVISGTALGDETLIRAAANVAWALGAAGKEASLYYCTPECNSLGLGLLGGKPLEEAAEALEGKGAGAVLVLENDLYRRVGGGVGGPHPGGGAASDRPRPRGRSDHGDGGSGPAGGHLRRGERAPSSRPKGGPSGSTGSSSPTEMSGKAGAGSGISWPWRRIPGRSPGRISTTSRPPWAKRYPA